jgi:hypothetical protein
MVNTHSLDLESSSSQYASISDASQTGLDITGDFTFEAWVKVESQPSSGFYEILSKRSGTDQRSYQFYYRDDAGTKRVGIGLYDSVTSNQRRSEKNITVSNDTWTHVAVTFDASVSTAEFFINGVSQGTESNEYSSIANSTAPFAIGCDFDNSGVARDFFDGLIDEVRVWNDIRTAQEIDDNKDVVLVGNESGLVGYWRFENNYLDTTANDNDLTAVNSSTFSSDAPFATSVDVEAPTLDFTLTLNAPTLAFENPLSVNAPTLNITATLNVPTLTYIDPISVTPPSLDFTLNLLAPSKIKVGLWSNQPKNTATWSNANKNTATWSNANKNTATWSNRNKS